MHKSLKFVHWLRKTLTVLLFVAFPATAQTVNPPTGPITFHDAPCTDAKVLQHVQPGSVPHLKSGIGFWNGKAYALCWGIMDIPPHGDVRVGGVPEVVIQQAMEGRAL